MLTNNTESWQRTNDSAVDSTKLYFPMQELDNTPFASSSIQQHQYPSTISAHFATTMKWYINSATTTSASNELAEGIYATLCNVNFKCVWPTVLRHFNHRLNAKVESLLIYWDSRIYCSIDFSESNSF